MTRWSKFLLLPLLALAGWAGMPTARAADDLAMVQQRVAQVEVLRGRFEQEKRITGFKNPLRSQWRFVVSRQQGVIWTTDKPFPSEVVITRDRILSRQRDGSQRVEVDGREQPALRSVNAMMFALVSGDVGALSARFETQVQALPDGFESYSTDVGDVSWKVPTAQFTAATLVPGLPLHSWQSVASNGSSIGRKGMVVAAKTLALAAVELLRDPALVAAARADFEKRTAGRQYQSLMPANVADAPHSR